MFEQVVLAFPDHPDDLCALQGKAGTAGTYNELMYRYAISMAAQEPNNAADCFKVFRSA